jgi:hypothetical protein
VKPLLKERGVIAKRELEEEFKRYLLEAIDESMVHILGETATQAIYFHLEHNEQMKREDIPDNLEKFVSALERIFSVGALVIEKTIMENLYSRLSFKNKKLSLRYETKEQFNFIDYINELRSICITL